MSKLTVFQRRLVATSALCGSASTLWILPPALLPFSDVSPMLVLVGVAVPAGVAGLFWACTQDQARAVAVRKTHIPQPERQRREPAR